MKKILFLTIAAAFFTGGFFAQQTIMVGSADYATAKANGTLGNYTVTTPASTPIRPNVSQLSVNRAPGDCFGYSGPNPGVPFDSPTDDGSIGPISFPFTFCMYGTNYTSFYLNANGNVSFAGANGSYSPAPFPSNSGNPMLAPFWGDIDMEGVGTAYYEVLPNAVILHWVGCGYFNNHTDKTVTFQLIFTDGNSPLLSAGNNVGFFYENMDWTSGDVGGTNGFGGTPMTVGVDNGDNTNGFQLGRFDEPGMAYDGPFGASDGIDWLDYKTFMFNVCNSSNIPPIINGFQVCGDTLRICLGDSLPINFDVLAVEQNQAAGAFLDTTGVLGYTEINYTPGVAGANGNPASLSGFFRSFVVDTFTIGINYFDDGVPLDTLVMNLIIVVNELPYNPIVVDTTVTCLGQLMPIEAGNIFDTYSWSDVNGVNVGNTYISSLPAGWNFLDVTINGCVAHDSVLILNHDDFTPVFSGNTIYCAPDSTVISVNPDPYVTMTWTENSGVDTLGVVSSLTLGEGTYNLAIEDTNGCFFNNNIEIFDFQSLVSITGSLTYCEGGSTLLSVLGSFDTYDWITTSDSSTTHSTSGEVSVIVSGLNGCFAYDTVTVSEILVPVPVITGDNEVCPNFQTVLTFNNPGYTGYNWLLGSLTPSTPTVNVFAGDYYLAVDFQGCLDTSDVFTVVESVIEDMNMSYSNKVCENSSVLLEAGSTYTSYSWSTGASTSGISVTQGGTYTLNVVDANGCLNDTAIIVQLYDGMPDISTQSTACLGDQISLQNGTIPNGTVTWTYTGPGMLNFHPNNVSAYPLVTVTASGQYEVILTHDECPNLADTLTVVYSSEPNLILPSSGDTICSGENVTVNCVTSEPSNTTWTNSNGDIVGIGESTILSEEDSYQISASNQCGIAVENYDVSVIICQVPNVITPNSDTLNQFFSIGIADSYDDVVLTIFNRWGRKVYEKSGYDNTWAGTTNGGSLLNEGVYYYVISYDNGTKSKKGTVTVFR